MTTLFALIAEVERDLISERSREGVAQAKASGKELGSPKGSLGVSRRDGREDEIRLSIDSEFPRAQSPRSPVLCTRNEPGSQVSQDRGRDDDELAQVVCRSEHQGGDRRVFRAPRKVGLDTHDDAP